MKNIFFFFKVLVITFTVVLVLQVKIKGKTLEERTISWVKGSSFIQPLQDFTLISLLLTRRTFEGFVNKVQSKLSSTDTSLPEGSRWNKFKIKRNKEAIEEESKKKEKQWGKSLKPKTPDRVPKNRVPQTVPPPLLQSKKVKSTLLPSKMESKTTYLSIRPDA